MENNQFLNLLEKDGNIAFNVAIFNRFSSIGDRDYSEICGGFIEGIYQWADHNINFIDECFNSKYYGWTIHFNDGRLRRVYIPMWVINITPKDWKHAKSLFNKYLLQDYKFNQLEENASVSYTY